MYLCFCYLNHLVWFCHHGFIIATHFLLLLCMIKIHVPFYFIFCTELSFLSTPQSVCQQSLHFNLSTIILMQLTSSNEYLYFQFRWEVIFACILTNFLLYYYHCNTIGACYFSGLRSSRVWHNETPASWPIQGQSGESQVGVFISLTLSVVGGQQQTSWTSVYLLMHNLVNNLHGLWTKPPFPVPCHPLCMWMSFT